MLKHHSPPSLLALLPLWPKDARGWPCRQGALHWEGAAMPSPLSSCPHGKPALIARASLG